MAEIKRDLVACRSKADIILQNPSTLFLYRNLSFTVGLVHEPIKKNGTCHTKVYPGSLLDFRLIMILLAFHGFQHVVDVDVYPTFTLQARWF